MYEVKDLKNIIEEYQEHSRKELNARKTNINNIYDLAKIDLKVIKNFEDSLKTYELIQKMLDNLQERIIQRNRED